MKQSYLVISFCLQVWSNRYKYKVSKLPSKYCSSCNLFFFKLKAISKCWLCSLNIIIYNFSQLVCGVGRSWNWHKRPSLVWTFTCEVSRRSKNTSRAAANWWRGEVFFLSPARFRSQTKTIRNEEKVPGNADRILRSELSVLYLILNLFLILLVCCCLIFMSKYFLCYLQKIMRCHL